MKKLLLATAIAAVAGSAFAAENDFYVRADVGAAWMPKATMGVAKAKRANHIVADLGVGTYLMDNVRTELTLANNFNAKQTFNLNTQSAKLKVKATSLTIKGLVDMFDHGYGKVFAGAGVGYTQLSAKLEKNAANVKAKKKNNVSWLLTAGSSFDVAEGVMLDVAYTYSDHGKTKGFDKTTSKFHFKTHNVTAGVRVEL